MFRTLIHILIALGLIVTTLGGTATRARAACVRDGAVNRWPGGLIPFFLHESLTDEQRATFFVVADYLALLTDIRFDEVSSDGPGVLVIRQDGPDIDWSYYEARTVKWTDESPGTLLHEITHGLGFAHEHQRSDRNQSVTVSFGNVKVFKRGNYFIATQGRTVGEFDFDSVMLYSSCSFTFDALDVACRNQDVTAAAMLRNSPDPLTGSRFISSHGDHYSATDQRAVHELYSGRVVDALDIILDSASAAATFCSGVPNGRIIVGDVTLTGAEDLSVPCLHRVVGNLHIQEFEGQTVDLSELQSVSGAVSIEDAPQLASVELPLLGVAGSLVARDLPVLESLTLGLELVFGSIVLDNLAELSTLDLLDLRQAAGLYVDDSAALRSLVAPMLTSLQPHAMFGGGADGALSVDMCPALEAVRAPALSRAGSVSMTNLPVLGELDLDALTSVESNLSLSRLGEVDAVILRRLELVAGDIAIESNPALEVVAMPALTESAGFTTRSITVHDNKVLERLALDSLGFLEGDLTITNNSSEALVIQLPVLEAVLGNVTVSVNPFLSELALPRLVVVLGVMAVRLNERLTRVLLTELHGSLGLDVAFNGRLGSFETPLLRVVEGRLGFLNNPMLVALSFPALEQVDAELTVALHPALSALELPLLTSTRSLSIASTSLPGVRLPALTRAGGFTISANDLLAGVDAPQLTTVESLAISVNGEGTVENLVLRLPGLSTIDGDFVVDRNPNLQSFRFLDPTMAGSLHTVAGATRLVTRVSARAQALVDHVQQAGGTFGTPPVIDSF